MDIGSSIYSSRLGEVLQINELKARSKGTRKDKQGIIDTFIKTNPIITPPPIKHQTSNIRHQTDLSTSSTKEDKKLVTENLANILATHGNIKKAIDIYKKLFLKYPEKKMYFAARIKKLQRKLL